jgi:choloylglycine hydrolase
MDYYVDYNIDEIRAEGMDVERIEDGLINVLFPDAVASVAVDLKDRFLDEKIETLKTNGEHCSTVSLKSPSGHVLFGRNFDYFHDACLILRVHGDDGELTSLAVLDLHYLNLDLDYLQDTSLFERIPLLFAPYYLQDGMNGHGVAVADMAVEGAKPPYDGAKPNILHSTAMRLILDDAKNTDEALAILNRYNVHFVGETCHFLIADASGKSVVVEFMDGETRVTPARETWQVCTNDPIYGKTEGQCDENCERYRTASERLANASATAGVDDVMSVMQAVSKEDWTMWSSVYDLTARELRFAYRRHYDKPYEDSLVESD